MKKVGGKMSIGRNILKLRKLNNLSQEELANKLNVTRQTISKWELDETTPDLYMAKNISNTLKISLDELVENEKDYVKTSNTEKLASIKIKILKITGIISLLLVAFLLIYLPYYYFSIKVVSTSLGGICYVNNEEYEITLTKYVTDNQNATGTFECINCKYEYIKEINSIINYNDLGISMQYIKSYFESIGGHC